MQKKWILKSVADKTLVERLSLELGIDKVLATLLVQRGIKTFEEARVFFRPQLSDLHDPFLMTDMQKAVDRLNRAIADKEKILIYGDYDVDGTTSVALMYSFLSKRHKDIGFYIPDRYAEGYGISLRSIDYAKANGYTLVIALDCGIKSIEKMHYAKSLEIDFIICDHHYSGDEIPKAVAVLDPKRLDCTYPFDQLSGCGVGFKLLQAFAISNNIAFEELIPYLDLVVVSIASDIVPIIGENRILAVYGLQQLNESPRVGLKSIIKISGLEKTQIAIDDIVFKIGPRINAAGRIESGEKAVDLLIAEDDKVAVEMGDVINDYNNTRKNIDNNITSEALELIGSNEKLQERMSTVLFNPKWHKGVIGIVASRLIEVYYRPTVILTESNGMATGSARSVYGFDLYQAIDSCSDLLESFGGHMYAAGLTMKMENLKAFEQRFEEYVNKTITPEQLVPTIEIDAELNFKNIDAKFFRILKQFQPFGPENMSPVFLAEEVVDNGMGRVVGSGGEHLKLELIQEENPLQIFPAIAFSQSQYYKDISKGKQFDICYSIDENEFRGNTTLQLRIRDIKFWK
jgi:single-stranded-DNA-specific exonuclease